MINRKLVALFGVAAIATAACGGGATEAPSGGGGEGGDQDPQGQQ